MITKKIKNNNHSPIVFLIFKKFMITKMYNFYVSLPLLFKPFALFKNLGSKRLSKKMIILDQIKDLNKIIYILFETQSFFVEFSFKV